jgi:hypothetical protein
MANDEMSKSQIENFFYRHGRVSRLVPGLTWNLVAKAGGVFAVFRL